MAVEVMAAAFRRNRDMIAAFVRHLLVIKSVYGDHMVRLRRSERSPSIRRGSSSTDS